MKIEVTDHSPVKKTLAVEYDAEAVEHEAKHLLKHYAQQARIPGFRKGKAPLSVVRTRFADDLKQDVRERLVSKGFRDAAEEKGLRPLGEPTLDEISDDDGGLRFKATFEVLPEVKPKDYKGVEVRKPDVAVGEADVDQALEEIRQSRAQLVTEEGRAAETGDFLVVDLEGRPEGGEAFKRERTMVEVGATGNLPQFNEHVEGATAGADLEFSVDYPKEYDAEDLAGKTVGYTMHVHEVKRREVPGLDDEFAKDLGEFDDLAALRARVREDLEGRREHEAKRAVEQSVVDKILIENPIPLPQGLVEEEIRHRMEDMVRSMIYQGMDPRQMDIDWNEIREKQDEPARKAVHARLVLDAIAREESLEVTKNEVDERIALEAARMGEKPETVREKIKEGSGVEAFKNQLLREKSLDLLTSVANILSEEK